MKTKFAMKLAASALVLGGVLVAANPMGIVTGIATAGAAEKADRIAAGAAARAEKYLKVKDNTKAILQAEIAVEAAPRNAAYRALLGQTYLQSGRLFAAETAFGDAVTLNPQDGRSTLSLALVRIALGQPEAALQTLAQASVPIAAADHGLALALAGDLEGAVAMLEAAAREENASAKVRQNLALTHALAGQWSQARAIAAQDVPADQLDRRMVSWAGFANPRNSWDQVAALLGIKPVLDRGQPLNLALAPLPAAEVQVAIAAPAPEPEVEARFETAAVAPVIEAPELLVAEAVQAPVVAEASLRQIVFAPRREVVQTLPVRNARLYGATAKRSSTPVVAARSVSGGYVVQLGAFSSAAKAEAAWGKANGRYNLARYMPNGTTFRSGKALYHRVSAGGFATRQDAMRMCASVKASGGQCFVRAATSEAPALWAQRASGQRIAAR